MGKPEYSGMGGGSGGGESNRGDDEDKGQAVVGMRRCSKLPSLVKSKATITKKKKNKKDKSKRKKQVSSSVSGGRPLTKEEKKILKTWTISVPRPSLRKVNFTPLLKKMLEKEASSEFMDPRLGLARSLRRKEEARLKELEEENKKNDYKCEREDEDAEKEEDLDPSRPEELVRLNKIYCLLREIKYTPSYMKKMRDKKVKAEFDHWEKNELNFLLERDCKCAERAITFYNQEHDSDYEVVETLKSYVHFQRGHWYHCNFKAQSKTVGTEPKIFFAELRGALSVKSCCVLDGHENIVSGCSFCPELICHPGGAFQVGHPNGRNRWPKADIGTHARTVSPMT